MGSDSELYSALRSALLEETTGERPLLVPARIRTLPKWDGKLFSRVLDPDSYFRLQEALYGEANFKLNHPHVIATAVVLGIRDEEGKRVFGDEDIARIKQAGSHGPFFEELAYQVLIANGLVNADATQKAIVKN